MVWLTRISFVLGAVALLASACADGGSPLSPESAAFETGGNPVVGGNRTDGGSGIQSAAAPPAPSDTTSRGGVPVVGGN